MINLGKVIMTIILVIVTLSVATALDDTLFDKIDNLTGEGLAGTAILSVIKVLYWVLIGASILIEFLFGFGLVDAMKKLNKLSM